MSGHRGKGSIPRNLSGRRAFLGRFAGLIAAGTAWRGAIGDDRSMIIRNSRPLDAETPVGSFGSWRTPTDLVFLRSHFGAPAVGLSPWSLAIEGLVDRPSTFSLDDLKGLPEITIPAVIQCSGNGRAFHRPIVPGVQWERGAVANAEWSGVRLGDLLEKAGISPESRSRPPDRRRRAAESEDAGLPSEHPARSCPRPEHDRRPQDQRRAPPPAPRRPDLASSCRAGRRITG